MALVATGILLATSLNGNGQNNSWINPGSSNWEDSASWSLGVPPGTNQSIFITNAGWKAVAIGANTANNFSQTLTVGSVTVSSPTNSFNSLLLNFVGVNSPLVANSVTLNTNSVITLHSSALQVRSNMSIGGIFNQNDFSGVAANTLDIGVIGPATYTMSNGTLTVTNRELLGGFGYPATFDQEGGYHYATPLVITNAGGEYDLHGGQLGGDVQIKHGILIQWGGDLAPYNFSDQGSYSLMGGTLEAANGLTIDGDGSAGQWGGVNTSSSLVLGSFDDVHPSSGIYTMVDGVMNLNNATIKYLGNLDQQGGAINITGALNMPTVLAGPAPGHFVWGNFSLEGGTFSAGSINLSGTIGQSGGTNQVLGDLAIQDGPANYILSGGLLSTANTLKTSGAFHQSGGVHLVQNLLQVNSPFAYIMTAGQLVAPNIKIQNSSIIHSGGDINNSAVLIMDFGRWIESAPNVQLGRLRVVGTFPSTLVFGTNPAAIHFLASSGQVWSNTANLTIEGWAGSLTGGGQSQVIFGNNASGLSASQVAHIQFTYSQGNLGAKILASGEVVPVISGLPFYPTDLTATALASNRIELTWTDNALNEYGYAVERSTDGTNYVQICATEANVTNYSDTEVAPATTYYYRARALNTGGNSAYSNIASATTKLGVYPLAGMIAWWRAESNALDSIGAHDAPTPFGSSYQTGKVGMAFDVPGLGNRLKVPDSPDFVLTNAFTVEGWMYARQASNGIVAMRGDARPGFDSWTLGMTNIQGDLSFIIDSDATGEPVEIDAPVQTNEWQHFAATFDATNGMRLYINGVLAAQTNTTVRPVGILDTNYGPGIGLGNSAVNSNFNTFVGALDEMALYSRALTATEIQNIYNAGTTGKTALTPVITSLAHQTNGAFQFNFQGPSGRSYEFDVSTDLVHWTPWTTQYNNSGAITIMDDTATNHPMRFYRTVPVP
jgi:hypothetical protein